MEKVDNRSEFAGFGARTDVHQHLWPETLLGALSRRNRPPYLRRDGAGWVLRIEGEADYVVGIDDHDPARRTQQLDRDGIDRALICLSSPLGIEALPTNEARVLIDAYHDGIEMLPRRFGAWGAVGITDPRADDVDELLDRGFVGVSLPAAALATAPGIQRCWPILERLESRGAPLLVHPGPAPWRRHADGSMLEPDWWPAMTNYIFDLHAAYHAFIAVGRDSYPDLRVVFVALAGGAPFHGERLASRGAAPAVTDEQIFFDTSSYGAKALDAAVRAVGVEQLVYGSDRPVVEPQPPNLGDAADAMIYTDNVDRLLGLAVHA